MKARIIQCRRGRHHASNRQYIVAVDGVSSREAAQKLVGKSVEWKSSAGTKVKGRVTGAHGGKGLVRAILERGLPGQALGTPAKVG